MYDDKGNLIEWYFDISKKVDIDSLGKQNKHINTNAIQIPNFSELKLLASKYEIFIDSKDPFEPDTSKIKIRDIKTGGYCPLQILSIFILPRYPL